MKKLELEIFKIRFKNVIEMTKLFDSAVYDFKNEYKKHEKEFDKLQKTDPELIRLRKEFESLNLY